MVPHKYSFIKIEEALEPVFKYVYQTSETGKKYTSTWNASANCFIV